MGKKKIKLDGDFGKKLGGSFDISGDTDKFSGEEKANMAINGLQGLTEIINGILNLVKEKEKTKIVKIEQETKIKKMDNELEAVFSQERIELEKIEKEFQLNYKQLENDSEMNRLQAKIIEQLIVRTMSLEEKVNNLENKYGYDNEYVLKLTDQLHQQSITLTNQLQLKG